MNDFNVNAVTFVLLQLRDASTLMFERFVFGKWCWEGMYVTEYYRIAIIKQVGGVLSIVVNCEETLLNLNVWCGDNLCDSSIKNLKYLH